jgi:hypothetical protein
MTLRARILASCVGALMLAASCGGGTGEGAATPSTAAAKTQAAVATQAAPVLAKTLVILGDTIRSQQGLTDIEKNINAPGIHCTQQSRFPQGGRIVWRMKALDPVTGTYLNDKDIASFTITFPDGKSDKFAYGGHGGTKEAPQDFLWAYGWTVPADYPTGALNVKIDVKSIAGASGSFDAFKVAAAQLTITKPGQDYPRQ